MVPTFMWIFVLLNLSLAITCPPCSLGTQKNYSPQPAP